MIKLEHFSKCGFTVYMSVTHMDIDPKEPCIHIVKKPSLHRPDTVKVYAYTVGGIELACQEVTCHRTEKDQLLVIRLTSVWNVVTKFAKLLRAS